MRDISLPPDWQFVPIRDVTVRTSQRDPSKQPDKTFRYVDVSSVDNTLFKIRGATELNGAEAPSRARKDIRTNDVLFATVRPTLRRVALVPPDLDGEIASTGYCVLRSNPERVESGYLYDCLLTDWFIDGIGKLERGANYPAVRDSDIFNARIPLPPLPEQRKIAGVLGVVQQAIEQQERLLQLTAELKKTLLHQLFTQGLRGESQKQTEIGLLPESWELRPCEELCETITVGVVVRPASHYVSSGVPAFRSLNVREDRLETEELVYFSEAANNTVLAKSKLQAGDVLVVRTGYPGTSCVVPREYDGANCIDLIIVRPKTDKVLSGFLSRFFNTPAGKRQAVAAKHGLAQQHLNVSAVKRTLVPVPPIIEQSEIDYALAMVQQRLAVIERRKLALTDLFRALLHHMMTAQIRVHDLDLPEVKTTTA